MNADLLREAGKDDNLGQMSIREYLHRRWRYFPYVLVVCTVTAVTAFNLAPQTAPIGRLLFVLPILLLTTYLTWMTVTPCPRCGRRLQAGGGVIWKVYAREPAKCVSCGTSIDESVDGPPSRG